MTGLGAEWPWRNTLSRNIPQLEKNTIQRTTKSEYILNKKRREVRAGEKKTVAFKLTAGPCLLKDNHWPETDLVPILHITY